jgi:hypothetical protein
MKIEKIIVSTNSNPLYFDFWETFSKVWKTKMGADPVLVYIDENPEVAQIEDKWGQVVRVKSVAGVPEYLQTQWSRFYFTKLFPDSVCMTSDIDMFPLSKEYFMDGLNSFEMPENGHVHLNGNGVTGKFDDWLKEVCNLTVCYHVNYGKRFAEVFDMADTWEEEILRLHNMNLGKDQSQWAEHLKGMVNWGAEEDYSTSVLRKKVTDNTVKFFSAGLYGHRFDRGHWQSCKNAINSYKFIDCHSLRPFKEYQQEIMEVLTHYFGDLNG